MMVDVCAMERRGADSWVVRKTIRCSEDDAPKYVKMFLDLGFDKVLVR